MWVWERKRERKQFCFTIKSPSPPIKVSAGNSATPLTDLEHCSNGNFSLSTQNTHLYRVYFLSFNQSFLYISCTQNHSFISLHIIIYVIIEGEKQCYLQNIYGNSSYLTPQFFLENTKIHISGLKRHYTSFRLFIQKCLAYLRHFPSPLPSAPRISNKAQSPLLKTGVTQMTLCSSPQNTEFLENKDADVWKVLGR